MQKRQATNYRQWLMAALFLLICLLPVSSARGDMADCIDATCRITVESTKPGEKDLGTGCVFEISGGRVYVLTNAHVVGRNQTVQCEFWQHGHRSQPLIARVINRSDRVDAAVVVLTVSQFAGRLPNAVPMAPRSYVIRPGQTITSVGCARGAWSTGWKGHALGYRGANLHFLPVPAGGRSGSAIFDANGTMIVGLLYARNEDDTEGMACSLQSIYAAFSSSATGSEWRPASETLTQCGPNGCEIPGGRSWLPYNGKLIPWKKQPVQQQQQSANPWPTLPTPVVTPPAPQTVTVDVDLTPISDQLSEITNLLLEMRETHHSTPIVPEPILMPEPELPLEDFEARRMADVNHMAILGLQTETTEGLAAVNGRIATTESDLATALGQIEELAGNHSSLKEKVAARVAKVTEELGAEATKREIRIAYVKDLIAEKMAGGGIVGLLKLLGMPAGMIVAAWLISRRIRGKLEAGEPLLIQKLTGELGELRGRLHDRVGRVRDRFGGDDPEPTPTPPAEASA